MLLIGFAIGILVMIAGRHLLPALWRLIRAILPVVLVLLGVVVFSRIALPSLDIGALIIGVVGAAIVAIPMWHSGYNARVEDVRSSAHRKADSEADGARRGMF
jgi:hypothetical protein